MSYLVVFFLFLFVMFCFVFFFLWFFFVFCFVFCFGFFNLILLNDPGTLLYSVYLLNQKEGTPTIYKRRFLIDKQTFVEFLIPRKCLMFKAGFKLKYYFIVQSSCFTQDAYEFFTVLKHMSYTC